jgi:hypothetical protein
MRRTPPCRGTQHGVEVETLGSPPRPREVLGMLDEAAFLASNKVLDWVALNEHLAEVRPIFDAFCTRNRFAYVNRLSLGRYPRMRIE